jgi:hypothetical protein
LSAIYSSIASSSTRNRKRSRWRRGNPVLVKAVN